jgi:hypothetical protein
MFNILRISGIRVAGTMGDHPLDIYLLVKK